MVDVFFRPLDARRHERLREASLEGGDCVLDEEEIKVGDLEDVVGEVAFEGALPVLHSLAKICMGCKF